MKVTSGQANPSFAKYAGRQRPRAGGLRGLVRLLTPTDFLLVTFLVAVAVGTTALMLPGSTRGGIRFIDALFTATSAVCVTALKVVDTGSTFTRQGQAIILALVQIGGLGIMSFSVIAVVMSGRRVSLRGRTIVTDALIPHLSTESIAVLKLVFVSTLLMEGGGMLLLWLFAPDRGWFDSLFHAVSAFCNAGLSLNADNLVRYRYNAGVNLTVCLLIVAGGLGFATHLELRKLLARTPRFRLSLQSRLVLVTTASLVLGGAIGFYVIESRNALQGEGTWSAILISLFHSITARTAGFHTIELTRLSNATLFMLILLMFVGASPGSTGGGIKTTTLGVLVGMARSRIRGDEGVHLFYRSVPRATVAKALSVLVLGFSLVTLAVVALAFVEIGNKPFQESDKQFIEIFFEVVSAFGTVGLSTGITPRLSVLGKFILVLVMFVGRVGPLTVAAAVGRQQARGKFRYAEENVMVG